MVKKKVKRAKKTSAKKRKGDYVAIPKKAFTLLVSAYADLDKATKKMVSAKKQFAKSAYKI